MEIRKAIITGPTGAVGVSLITELLRYGVEVTAVCRPNSKRIRNIPKSDLVSIVECDLSDLLSLKNKVSGKYDVFYHFGWDGTYGESRQDLRKQLNNVVYTLDAVDLAKYLECSVFVGAGSQSEFGHVHGIMTPKMSCDPDNGYGIAKLAAGKLSRIKCQKEGIRHEWCRIISLYGPYDGDHTFIMTAINSFLDGKRMSCTKCDQLWDYIYSKDAASIFRLVAERGIDGEVYCLGSGKTNTLKHYLETIKNMIDKNAEVGYGELDYYPNQVMHLEADISNIVKDLGFVPNYSFEEGIAETIEWVNKQKQ